MTPDEMLIQRIDYQLSKMPDHPAFAEARANLLKMRAEAQARIDAQPALSGEGE